MGEFFKYFRKFLIKAGSQHNGVAAPLFLLLGLEFERFFSALDFQRVIFAKVTVGWILTIEGEKVGKVSRCTQTKSDRVTQK